MVSMDTSITQDKPFRFLDLPQELQTEIIKLHYSAREITFAYSSEAHLTDKQNISESPKLIECPDASLLLINKHIYTSAEPIYVKARITLRVPYHPVLDFEAFFQWLNKIEEDHKLSEQLCRVVALVFVDPDISEATCSSAPGCSVLPNLQRLVFAP